MDVTCDIFSSLEPFANKLSSGGTMTAGPAHGSSAITLASLVSRERNILFITAHGEDADEAFAMLEDIGTNVALFPALEFDIATELVASRLALLERLSRGDFQGVVVASITSIMQMSPAKSPQD